MSKFLVSILLACVFAFGVSSAHQCVHDELLSSVEDEAVLESGDGAKNREAALEEYIARRTNAHIVHGDVLVSDDPNGANGNNGNGNGNANAADTASPNGEQNKEDPEAGMANLRVHIDYRYLDAEKDETACKEPGQELDSPKKFRCQKSHVLGPAAERIKALVNKAAAQFKAALKLKPVTGALKIAGIGISKKARMCGLSSPDRHVDIPEEHLQKGEGVQADVIFYVTGRPTRGGSRAWALPCRYAKNGRPVMALLNIGPNAVDPSGKNEAVELAAVLHEMSHALGFSKHSFKYFVDEKGQRRKNAVVTYNERGHTVKKLNTPAVMEALKAHWGIKAMKNPGAELEDGGGATVAGSDLEKRLFDEDWMTGKIARRPVFSAISLSVFTDSGWYRADLTRATRLPWGYKRGALFAEGKCSWWKGGHFCKYADQSGCTADGLQVGSCNAREYAAPIPKEFRYFGSNEFLGGDALADYCPRFAPLPLGHGDCQLEANNNREELTKYGQGFGGNSRCFVNSLDPETPYRSFTGGCFKFACSVEYTVVTLRVEINGKKLKCPTKGGKLSAKGFKGHIWCPHTYTVCGTAADMEKSKKEGGNEGLPAGSPKAGHSFGTISADFTPAAASTGNSDMMGNSNMGMNGNGNQNDAGNPNMGVQDGMNGNGNQNDAGNPNMGVQDGMNGNGNQNDAGNPNMGVPNNGNQNGQSFISTKSSYERHRARDTDSDSDFEEFGPASLLVQAPTLSERMSSFTDGNSHGNSNNPVQRDQPASKPQFDNYSSNNNNGNSNSNFNSNDNSQSNNDMDFGGNSQPNIQQGIGAGLNSDTDAQVQMTDNSLKKTMSHVLIPGRTRTAFLKQGQYNYYRMFIPDSRAPSFIFANPVDGSDVDLYVSMDTEHPSKEIHTWSSDSVTPEKEDDDKKKKGAPTGREMIMLSGGDPSVSPGVFYVAVFGAKEGWYTLQAKVPCDKLPSLGSDAEDAATPAKDGDASIEVESEADAADEAANAAEDSAAEGSAAGKEAATDAKAIGKEKKDATATADDAASNAAKAEAEGDAVAEAEAALQIASSAAAVTVPNNDVLLSSRMRATSPHLRGWWKRTVSTMKAHCRVEAPCLYGCAGNGVCSSSSGACLCRVGWAGTHCTRRDESRKGIPPARAKAEDAEQKDSDGPAGEKEKIDPNTAKDESDKTEEGSDSTSESGSGESQGASAPKTETEEKAKTEGQQDPTKTAEDATKAAEAALALTSKFA